MEVRRTIAEQARLALALGAVACKGPLAPAVQQGDLLLDQGWSATPWAGADPGGPTVGVMSLRTTVHLDAAHVGAGSVLVLEGLWWSARVSVDGTALAPVEGGIPAVEVPVGPLLHEGDNLLAIDIRAPSGQTRAALGGGLASSNFRWAAADLRVAPRLVVRPAEHVDTVTILDTSSGVVGRATVAAADGATVHFLAALDGHVVQDLGEAVVRGGIAQAAPVAWKGARWGFDGFGEDALLQVVASLSGPEGTLDVAAARTGVRAIAPAEGGPLLNGRPLRLMAVRLTEPSHPEPFADRVRALLPGRPDAVEVHGEVLRSSWLDQADELGIPIVLLPRCIGRCEPVGPPDAALAATMQAQDARLVTMALDHPSVVLWMTEGNAPGQPGGVAPLWSESLLQDPHGRPVVGQHYRGRMLGLEGGGGRCQGAWITEVTRRGPKAASEWQEMSRGFTDVVKEGAVGGTIPVPNPNSPAGWAESWAAAAEALGVPALDTGCRRASSVLQVEGLPPGATVWLSAPGMTAVGAIADPAGTARFEVWYDGAATLTVDGQTREVKLRHGTWKGMVRQGETPTVRW